MIYICQWIDTSVVFPPTIQKHFRTLNIERTQHFYEHKWHILNRENTVRRRRSHFSLFAPLSLSLSLIHSIWLFVSRWVCISKRWNSNFFSFYFSKHVYLAWSWTDFDWLTDCEERASEREKVRKRENKSFRPSWNQDFLVRFGFYCCFLLFVVAFLFQIKFAQRKPKRVVRINFECVLLWC